MYGDHPDLHVLTHSFPTRRSSDLNILPLRRALLTRFVFSVFKKVLPEMSSTEREVLESGDVWWEAEMFRGRPDWERLLSFKYTKLTPEEQSFLDNECEALRSEERSVGKECVSRVKSRWAA